MNQGNSGFVGKGHPYARPYMLVPGGKWKQKQKSLREAVATVLTMPAWLHETFMHPSDPEAV